MLDVDVKTPPNLLSRVLLSHSSVVLSKKSFNFLNEEPCWDDIKFPLLEHKINSFEPLLTRIEDDQINQLMELKNV